MLTIRLQRGGKRNTAQYKVVLAKKTAANQKQFVEILGAYNPHSKELTIRSQERLNYWMNEQHVELSETVHNLFVTKELIKDKKVHAFTIPKKEVTETPEEKVEAPASEAEDAPEAAVEATTESAPASEEPTPEPAATPEENPEAKE
jgi:small subunit ribosomal protein S16